MNVDAKVCYCGASDSDAPQKHKMLRGKELDYLCPDWRKSKHYNDICYVEDCIINFIKNPHKIIQDVNILNHKITQLYIKIKMSPACYTCREDYLAVEKWYKDVNNDYYLEYCDTYSQVALLSDCVSEERMASWLYSRSRGVGAALTPGNFAPWLCHLTDQAPQKRPRHIPDTFDQFPGGDLNDNDDDINPLKVPYSCGANSS
jgi:hypothetical protein